MDKLVDYKKVKVYQADSVVLEDVDFHVDEGEFIYIIGKVGSGKSSLLKTLYCELDIEEDDAEKAEVLGRNLITLRRKEIPALRREMGIIFQDFQLLHDRNVERNLYFVLKATGWRDKEAMSKRIDEVLAAVGMTTKAHKMPHQLSGGEQQRIAIARAILNSPEVILADEPTGNLDEETAEGILQLLQQINREKGTAIVMVTHNRSICTRYPGRIFETRDETCQEIAL